MPVTKLWFGIGVGAGLAVVPLLSQAQQCDQTQRDNAPTERFVIHDDLSVTDRITGLDWQRCGGGRISPAWRCLGFHRSHFRAAIHGRSTDR